VAPIPTRATGVEYWATYLHADGQCSHHSGRAGNLSDGLPFDMERGQERADLCRGRLTIHDLGHDRSHFLLNKVAAGRDAGDSLLHGHDCLIPRPDTPE
jgi:hypothetical protein